MAGYVTKGAGYYEEYRASQNFSEYGLPDFNDGTAILTTTDLVRQLWLDNYLYGTIFSLQQQNESTQFTLGGGWNKYNGEHYGIATWAQQGFPNDYHFYDLKANKTDFNIYAKLQQQLSKHWQGFTDVQLRSIKYVIKGFEKNPDLLINKKYTFINPKVGITYTKKNYLAYLSYSMAGKEPNRNDFEAGISQQPLAERLHDIELGVEKTTLNYSFGVTGYYMHYRNQLILTGKINDVGSYTRTNTPSSYRLGIELQGKLKLSKRFNAEANFTLSKNKIKRFIEYMDDYDNGRQLPLEYHNTDISFSPGKIASATFNFIPLKNAEISVINKYVGRQYLDNTSKISRSLDSYYIQDVRASYKLFKKIIKETNFVLQVSNLFDKKYESNGYTFSYLSGGNLTTENYYFPMAGINFMAGINIRL